MEKNDGTSLVKHGCANAMLKTCFTTLLLISAGALCAQSPAAGPAIVPPPAASLLVTNAPGSNQVQSLIANLAPALSRLETQMQQTLSAIAVLNATVGEARALGATFLDEVASNSVPTTTSGQMLATNLGVTYATRTGIEAGQNVSVSPHPAPAASANTATNAAVIPVLPMSSQAARAIILLQNDLERLLPILAALNGGPSTHEPGNAEPGGATLQPGGAPALAPVGR